MSDLIRLTAADAARRIKEGTLTSEALVRACLARIAERDEVVRAWAYVDPLMALQQARERDRSPATGVLHGVPVGIKDMIDTADMPTQHNSPIYVGHRPGQDAAVVSLLRSAGAVILGNTDTHEFAAGGRLPPTRNPHNPEHTAGGSSSGSGAAVGDYMVPLALGTQTAGSTLRPGSFNGIYAMKPTWNVVPREGAKIYSLTLDTIGWYGRCVDDLSLVALALGAISELPGPAPAPNRLRVAVCRTPMWDRAEPASRSALESAAERLRAAGAAVEELDLPTHFRRLWDVQAVIMRSEGRPAFLAEYRRAFGLLSQDFRDRVEGSDGYTPAQILEALDFAASCRPEWDRLAQSFDAVLTPSAVGEAPKSLKTTGDPTFQRAWTTLHAPCINIPGFFGPTGLPIGVTVVGPRLGDAGLLQAAASIAPAIGARVGV
jgi:Asp-tRNA(Asn)/Glu-tRNA(Gln) amidotransferase A subunit family amidase